MRIAFRTSLAVVLTLCCAYAWASEEDPQKITITGTLTRSMTIGAETSGWVVQVDSEAVIDGKPISSIEVNYGRDPKKLDAFENKRVKIAGKVAYRHGVETGTQTYVEISSIKEFKGQANAALSLKQPAVGLSTSDLIAVRVRLQSRVVVNFCELHPSQTARGMEHPKLLEQRKTKFSRTFVGLARS